MTKNSGYYLINEQDELRYCDDEETAQTAFRCAVMRLGQRLGDANFEARAELMSWGELTPRGKVAVTRVEHEEGCSQNRCTGMTCAVCIDSPYQDFKPEVEVKDLPPQEDKALALLGLIVASTSAAILGAEWARDHAVLWEDRVDSNAVIRVLSELHKDWKAAFDALRQEEAPISHGASNMTPAPGPTK